MWIQLRWCMGISSFAFSSYTWTIRNEGLIWLNRVRIRSLNLLLEIATDALSRQCAVVNSNKPESIQNGKTRDWILSRKLYPATQLSDGRLHHHSPSFFHDVDLWRGVHWQLMLHWQFVIAAGIMATSSSYMIPTIEILIQMSRSNNAAFHSAPFCSTVLGRTHAIIVLTFSQRKAIFTTLYCVCSCSFGAYRCWIFVINEQPSRDASNN